MHIIIQLPKARLTKAAWQRDAEQVGSKAEAKAKIHDTFQALVI